MSYKFLDHSTDAIIEINAKDLKEAFSVVADAVINLTLDHCLLYTSDAADE